MNEPQIQSYTRPLYEEEVNEHGEINLHEQRYNFGVYFTDGGNKGKAKPFEIPKEVGRVVSGISKPKEALQDVIIPHVNCTDIFTWANLNLVRKEDALANAYCFDPNEALVVGVSTFGSRQKAVMYFQPCMTDPDVSDPESTCL